MSAPGGGLGFGGFFSFVWGLWENSSKEHDAIKAAMKAGMSPMQAAYHVRQEAAKVRRAEEQMALMEAESKKIEAETNAINKINEADAKQEALLEAMEMKKYSDLILIGGAVGAGLITIYALKKSRSSK